MLHDFLVSYTWWIIPVFSFFCIILGYKFHIKGFDYSIRLSGGNFFAYSFISIIGFYLDIFLFSKLNAIENISYGSYLIYYILICLLGIFCISWYFLAGMRRIQSISSIPAWSYPIFLIVVGIVSNYIDEVSYLIIGAHLYMIFAKSKA
ncbi:MAG: hypothetical protein E6X90_08600 [Veillonella sp.]|nr:hypothetical protein [Veillonella sp.]